MRFIVAEILRPFAERTVAGDFIMFDGLAGGEEPRVQRRTFGLFHQSVSLLDQAFNGIALFAGCLFPDRLEDLLQLLDLFLRFQKMLLVRFLQLRAPGRLGDFGQRLGDRVFGVINVLKSVLENI